MADDDQHPDAKHLTAELRKHFARMGPSVVEFDLVHHHYSAPEKKLAALAWLAERRQARERVERIRFWVLVVIAGATLIATVIGVIVSWK